MTQDGPGEPQPAGAGSPAEPARAPGPTLGRRLAGDLPCVVCQYNLKGLSIRSVCPECGTPVRATILSIVDPLAAELTPIRWPALVASGLVLSAAGAFAAAALCWLPYFLGVHGAVWRASVMAGVAASAVGTLALVRPHGGIPARSIVMAAAAVVLYAPVMYILWLLTDPEVLRANSSFRLAWEVRTDLLWLRAVLMGLVIAIILLLRPNFRLLVARSLILRTGRVDRQTLYAIAAAAGVAGLGRLMIFGAVYSRSLAYDGRIIGSVLVFLGSALVTLGLAGAVVDCWRIGRSILAPSPTLRQVLGRGAPPRAKVQQETGQ